MPRCLGFGQNLSPWYSHPTGLLSNPFSLNPVCPRRLSIWKGQYHILYCIGISYEMVLVIFWYGIINLDWQGFRKCDVGGLKSLLKLMCICRLPEIDLLLCEGVEHNMLWSPKYLLRARYILKLTTINFVDFIDIRNKSG